MVVISDVVRRNHHLRPTAMSQGNPGGGATNIFGGAASSGWTTTAAFETGVETPVPRITTTYTRTHTGTTSTGSGDYVRLYLCDGLNPAGDGSALPAGTRFTFGALFFSDWVNPGDPGSRLNVAASARPWRSTGNRDPLPVPGYPGWYWATTSIVTSGSDTGVGAFVGAEQTDATLQTFPFRFRVTACIVVSGPDGQTPETLAFEDYFDGDTPDVNTPTGGWFYSWMARRMHRRRRRGSGGRRSLRRGSWRAANRRRCRWWSRGWSRARRTRCVAQRRPVTRGRCRVAGDRGR